jgi:small subunit ribosomal protein S17
MQETNVKHPIRCVVTSDSMDKSRVGTVERLVKEGKTKKYVRRTTKLMFHDESNLSKVGDQVLVVSSRPLSAQKRFRLVSILDKSSDN